MNITSEQRAELKALDQQFQILGVEKGLNKHYIFPDDKEVEKIFSNHPDFERWMELYGFDVMSASLRFGSY